MGAPDASENLWPLAALRENAGGELASDKALWNRMTDFVRNTLQSGDLNDRVAAFEALSLLFDGNFATKNPRGEMVVNPEFVELIEFIVEHESNEKLHGRAQFVLQTLDRRLAKVVRKRGKLEGNGR